VASRGLRRTSGCAAVVASLVLLRAHPAEGQTRPSAVLVYERADAAAGCPDEAGVRNAVSGRLGYDPFTGMSDRTVVARIRRAARGLVADVELRDAAGALRGSRQLTSTKGDCRELAAAMDLAISIAIDPLVLSRPSAPAPAPVLAPPAPTAGTPAASAPPAPPAMPPPAVVVPPGGPRDRITVRTSLGTVASLGSAPGLALGFTAQVGLRWRLASVGLEGRADLPASADIADLGRVKSSLLVATLAPCGHGRLLLACALVSVGTLQGAGERVAQPRQESTFYAAAGARLGAELPLVRVLYLRVHLDLLATLTRTTLHLDDKPAWITPPVSGALGISVGASFP
jgi:hypothetical protein